MNDTLRIMQLTVLAAVLVLPVTGWAGEKEYIVKMGDPIAHCMVYQDKDLGLMMNGPGCPKHQAPACYQRMREAMRLMEAFMQKQEVIPAEDYARIKEQWNQTMRDCVEGQ